MKVNLLTKLNQKSAAVLLILLVSFYQVNAQQTFTTFQDADLVVGQSTFATSSTTINQTTTPRPAYCAISSKGVLAVAESTSPVGGRVMIWNNPVTTNGPAADVVIGKPTFNNSTNGTSQSIMTGCTGVAFSPDGNKLIVSDGPNHRVLIWNSIPTTNGQNADVVIGQVDFISSTFGTSTTALNSPAGVFVSPNGKLFICDQGNNRVLVYNKIPTTNNVAADLVVGQAIFTSATSSDAADKLNQPRGVWVSNDGKLLIADQENNRVVVFNSVPVTNGATANVVIGQPAFNTSGNGTSASQFFRPIGVTVSPYGQLAIGELGNDRVVLYNSIPTANGVAADVVLGQSNFTSNGNCSGLTAKKTCDVQNVSYDINGRLFVPGMGMSRVLVFGTRPTSNTDLQISLSALSSTLCNGNEVRYIITVKNNGPDLATDIVSTSALPALFNLATSSATTGTYNNAGSYWNIPSLASGASAVLTLTGSVATSTPQQLSVYASVIAVDQLDPVMSNNGVSVTTTVSSGTSPSGGTLSGTTSAATGQPVTLTLSGVTNATGYVFSVTGVTSFTSSGNTVSFNMGSSNATVNAQAYNSSCAGSVFSQVVTLVSNGITTGSIGSPLCAGSSINVPFSAFGTFTGGNIFTAQLSNGSGSFASPVAIGTFNSTTSGAISATIPISTAADSTYRIRVVSSLPATTGSDNGSNITIGSIPVISCPANISVNSAPGLCSAPVTFTATATGTPSPIVTYSHASGSSFNVGTTTVTATATNSCGESSCTFTVTVSDVQNPLITTGSISTCYATVAAAQAAALAATTATDNCPGTITYSASTTGTCSAVVTITATDIHNNSSSTTYNTRIDNTPPAITCAASATIDCPAVPTWPAVTASDACDADVTIAFIESTSGTCPKIYTRTYTATDDCGNTSTCSRSVTVRDITSPAIICAASATIDCPAVPTWPAVTASDACDADVAIAFIESTSGSCPKVYTRTYTATDDCGNTATCSRSVTVRDITAPAIICAASATIDCPVVPTWPAVTASDACDADVTIAFVETTSGSCPKIYTRTYTATDDCGNTSTCSRSVTVRDITAPAIICAASATIDCPAVPTWPAVTASDACSTPTVAQLGAEIVSGTCPTVYTRTYIATDDCGNTSTCSRSVTVRDITSPAIICAASATIDCPAVPTWPAVTASDACDADVTIAFVETTSGTCPTVYTRTYTATDDCGNTATCSRSVSVRDITAPAIACAANATIDCPAIPSWPLPTASDACGTPTVAQLGAETVSGTCPTVYTRNYIATDDCGNTSTCSRSVTVRDITAPAIICAASATIDCPTVPTWPAVTASDACDADVTIAFVETTSGTCPKIYTRTYTATDDCGNTSTCSRSVTVRDITAPAIICAASATIDCPVVPTWPAVTASDACDADVTIAFVETTSGSCPKIYTRTYTATDDCGNTSTCSRSVTVRDITAPAIICAASATIDCPAVPTWPAVTASDACSTPTVAQLGAEIVSGTCPTVYTRTYIATDDCGNTSTCSRSVTVRDITSPAIFCAASATIDCPAVPTWPAVTASDACDADVTIAFVETTSGTCPTVYTRTYTATDDCGNTATCSRSVSVRDITAPAIACAANATIDCPAIPSWPLPTATDACGTPTVVQLGAETVSGTCPAVYTRAYIATDDCGNTATCSRSVTVRDITSPVITCAASATIDCPAVPTWPAVTASDACDNDVTIAFVESTSGTCPKIYTRTYTATDDCGNTATCSRSVTVRDITSPAIICAASATIDCPVVPTWPVVTASDACDADVTIAFVETTSGTCPKIYTRTYTATDDCGNTSTCSRSVTVRDITSPAIICAASATIDCPAVPTWPVVTASDACDADVTIAFVETTSGICPTVYTRTYTATDDCGNSSTCSRSVTIRDITAPTINCAANSTINCTAFPTYTWPAVTGSDACDTDVEITMVGETTAGTCPTVYTRTYLATDDCGNTTTCSRSVSVRDITAPTITCAANATIDCPDVPSWPTPKSSDDCSTPTVVQLGAETVSGICPAVYTRTYVATDDCGNTTTCSRSVTVRDITSPTITCPANTTIDCPAVVSWGLPTASDECDASVDIVIVSTTSSGICPTVHTRTWRAVDDCGNTSTCSATITVRDITAPAITCAASATIDCPVVPTWPAVTASDACDANVAIAFVETTSGTCPKVYTRTYTATDDCGNTATCSRSVSVRDITSPAIFCAASATIDCPAVPTWPVPTASDACSTPTVAQLGAETVSGTCPTVHTRTYIATDDCGNTSTCSRSVTIRDITAPTINCAANSTINCTAFPTYTWPAVTGSDACDTDVDVTLVGETTAGTCPTVYTRTYLATDDCGNTTTCSRSVSVRDITAPTITCAANATIDCPDVPSWPTPKSSDDCSTPTVVQLGAETVSGICPAVYTRTYVATDDCGNTTTCSRSVTVRDITSPTITCPANTTIDCPAVVSWGLPTASDECDASVDIIIVSTTSSGICPTVHTRTWRAVDNCGNTSTCSATITVRDITAPAITCPANITVNNATNQCGANVNYAVTATDACSSPAWTYSIAPGSFFNIGTTTVSSTASDDCGNTSTCSFTVTVVDNVPPILSCPPNTTVSNNPNVCGAVFTYALLTGDNCGAPTITRLTGLASGSTFPIGTTTTTYRATDASGNTSTCSFTVTVNDTQAPAITCPANTTVNNTPGGCSTTFTYAVSHSDNCPGQTLAQLGGLASGATFPVGTTTNSFRATDASGNTSTCAFTVTVIDNQPPTAVCQSITVQLNAAGTVSITPAQINNGSSDNCGTVNLVSVGPNNFNCSNVGTATATANDLIISEYVEGSSNNKYIEIFNGTSVTKNLTNYELRLYANGSASATTTNTLTAAGSLAPGATVVLKNSAATVYGGTALVFSAVNWSGNDAIALFNTTTGQNADIFGKIGTDPGAAWTLGGNSTADKTLRRKSTVVNGVTVNPPGTGASSFTTLSTEWDQFNQDVVSGLGAHTFTPPPVSNTVTLTVSDASGNISTCTASVVVQDVTPPVAICKNVTIQLDATGNGVVSAAQVNNGSTDACGIASTSVSPGSFTCANVGANTVTLTVTDVNGNTSTCSSSVTVQDVTPPTANCQSITVQLNAAGTASISAAQINNGSTDACGIQSTSVSPNTFNCSNVNGDPVTDLIISEYLEGSGNNKYIEIYNGTSASINLSDYQLRNYSNGNSAPNFNNALTGTLAPGATAVYKNATATIYGGTATTLTSVQFNGNDAMVLFKISTGNFVDIVGRIGEDPGTAWILGGNTTLDKTLRRKSTVHAGVTTNPAAGFPTLASEWDQFNIDDVSGLGAHNMSNGNQVTLTVIDVNGNSSTCTAAVIVQDLIAPTITCPSNISANTDPGQCTASVTTPNPGTADNCSVTKLTWSLSGQTSGSSATTGINNLGTSTFNKGATTVAYTVTDASGNTASCSFTVTVTDNQAPTIACPANTTVNNNANVCGALFTYVVSSADNCPGQTVAQLSGLASGANFPTGTTTNSFRVTDASGNTATCSFTVTVNDNQAPTIACPANATMTNDANVCGATYSYTVTSSDNCPGQTVAQLTGLASGATFPIGTTTNSFRVTDASGNTATCSFTVTVNDNQAPTIACPSNTTVNNDPGNCSAVYTYAITSSDNCTGQTVAQLTGLASGAAFPVGTTTNSFRVTDASGNTATCSFTVTVADNQNPVLHNCPVSFSSCNPISWTPPTATDNCSAVVTSNLNPGVFPSGITTVIYTATDPSGNSSTCSFQVTVLEPSAAALSITSDHANNQFCSGDSVTLTLNGGSLGHLAEWKWYSGACGGTLVASNTTTIKVAPQFATTYYVRAEGYCNTTNCVAITVINGSIYQTSVAAAIPSEICEDATSLLNAIFTVRTNPALLITEITQNDASLNGATSPRPAYFGAFHDDFIEISNLSSSTVSLNGVTFELWSGTSLNRTYSFPGATSIAGHGVLVLHIGSGTNSPADNYYHTGGSTNSLASGTPYGFLLKTGSAVLDAVASNGYSWPGASGVTAASWTGTMVSNAGSAGSIRIGYIDNNDGGDWIAADNSIRQTLGTYNGNYASNSQPAFIYSWTPTTYLDDATISTPTVSGAAPGNYVYNVTATNPESGCSSSASANLTVYALPTASISGDAEICVGGTTSLTFNFTGAGPFIYSFTDGTNTYGPFTSASPTATRFVTPAGSGSDVVTYTLLSVSDIHCNGTLSGSASISFDQEAPSFSGCPADFVACNPVTWIAPSAADNCSVSSVNSNYSPGDTFPAGTTTVTYVATDSNGNSTECSFDVTLSTVPPSFTGCPASFSSCNPVTWTAPVATGICSIASVTSNYSPGDSLPSGTTTVTYIATDSNGNTAACSFNVTILAPSSITGAAITSNRPYNNICTGDNATLSVSGGTLGAGAQWRWYSGSCNGTLIASGVTSIIVNPTVTTTYFAKIVGTCNTTACLSLQLVVNSGPPTALPTVVYAPTVTYQGAIDSVMLSPVAGASYYLWSSNGNAQLIFSAQLSPFIPLTAPYQTSSPKVYVSFINPSTQGNGIGNYHIQYVAGNACGRANQQGSVRIRATVAQPTTLSGPSVACSGLPAKIYTVSAVVGAKSYQWSLTPASAGTITGNGTQTVSIVFAAGYTSAQLCVYGVTAFNSNGPALCMTVSKTPSAPTAISGNPTPCPSSQSMYIATPVTGATSYVWTVPPGASIVGATTDDTLIVQFPASFAGQVCVSANSGCGISVPSCLSVTPGVAAPLGTITGTEAGVCGLNGINYQVPFSGALSYTWNAPSGATIASGQGTNAVLIDFTNGFAGGNISIVASNLCGITNGSLAVTGAPASPVITSDNPLGNYACETDIWTYTATSSGGNTYSWYVHPDTGNIIPTIYPNEIIVEWLTSGGNISVVASNDCGSSDSITLTINSSCPPRLAAGSGVANLKASVFPNPNDGKATLQLNSGEETSYQLNITDLAGRKLRTENLKVMEGPNSFDLDLSTMAKGVYMLSLENASGRTSVIRVVVE